MKHLTIIVHTDVQQALTDHLRGMEQVPGFTFSRVEGHGVHGETDTFLSARDKVVGHEPRIQVDILLNDTDVDSVLKDLRESTPGVAGEAVFWVADIDRHGRL